MGRKLNLSHLNEEECRQVLAVIQRDFTIRQKEKERMVQIQELVESEAQKRLVLSRQLEFNTKHCICCFSTFGMIFNKKVKCEKCNFFICKDCRTKSDKKEEVICLPCDKQRQLQEQACQWFYNEMKAKFRRFGSAKVVRSLYKRQTESGGSDSEHNSDSGVDHPFSPLQTKGGGHFKRNGSAETIDEETNTESEMPADSSALYAALLLKNPDWLKQYKPPSESIGVQAPDDNTGQQSGKEYWDLLGSSEGAEGRLKHDGSEESDSDVSSVEEEIAGLESSPAGKVMSSVYSLDNTTPFKVSTATYFISNPGEVVETHGGNTETDENENGLKMPAGTDEVSTDSDESEKFRSTYMLVVEPDHWREPADLYESRVARPDE